MARDIEIEFNVRVPAWSRFVARGLVRVASWLVHVATRIVMRSTRVTPR